MEFQQADKATTRLEKDYIKTLNTQYQIALDDIKLKISKIYDKYGVDGKLDMATMQVLAVKDQKELTRLTKLFKQIDEDLNSLNRGRPQELAGYLTDVYEANANIVADKLNQLTGVSFKTIPREAVYNTATSELSKLALETNATVIKQNIKRSITTSIVQGEGIRDMSKRISKDLETNANNAVKIARTETTRNMNDARLQKFQELKDAGVDVQKQWIATKDERTRLSHQDLDRKIVDLDKPFVTINGNELMYAGDQSAGASEVINCRCTIVAYLPEYE